MKEMTGARSHQLAQIFGRILRRISPCFGRSFRRWLIAFARNPSPVRGPEVEAYRALCQLRRRRRGPGAAVAATAAGGGLFGASVDDPQVNLRITL